MADKKDNSNVESVSGNPGITRRKAVKTIAGGVSALAAYHTLPVNWSTPIIEQIFVPAHAQTSGAALVDPSIPVGPGHPDHPDFPHDPDHPDHPHNSPTAVINNATLTTFPPNDVIVDYELTLNRIAQYTIVVTNTSLPASTPGASATRLYVNQSIPTALSLTDAVTGSGGDTISITITNNISPDVVTRQYVVPATFSLSCAGTPSCGSIVTSGQSVSVTVTVTPNPGAGQQVDVEGFCGGSSTGLTSLDTNANGQVTVTGAVPTTLCSPADGNFLFVFTYSGATCACDWLLP